MAYVTCDCGHKTDLTAVQQGSIGFCARCGARLSAGAPRPKRLRYRAEVPLFQVDVIVWILLLIFFSPLAFMFSLFTTVSLWLKRRELAARRTRPASRLATKA